MEENKRKLPSLPPNYVTLVQLRERWMKQKEQQLQQRKQKEKSEDDEQQEKSGVALASTEKKIELEAEGEGLKKNASKKKHRYLNKERKARAKDKGATGGGGGGETHSPQATVAIKDVVIADRTVGMEGKFQVMSIDGGNDKSTTARPQSNKGRSFHSGKYANHLRDREGRKAKNSRGMMVWVKKGDNVGGCKSSI